MNYKCLAFDSHRFIGYNIAMNILLKIALRTLSLRPFSRLWGHIVRLRHPRFLVKRVIEMYRNAYNIDMADYQGETTDYKSLSDFFVRPLDPDKRPLNQDLDAIVSPCDGVFSSLQTVHEDQATQVKGKTYAISQLIGETIDFSLGWHVAVIYLAPFNYHRYHYPLTGTIERYLHTGNRLFPVNPMGLDNIDRLLVRNERIVTLLKETETGLPFYVIPVGATFVGSIKMEFIREKKNRHRWHPVDTEVTQLQEMGRFDMGSTIVMVFPEKMAKPIPDALGKPVTTGQPLFSLGS